MYACVSVQPLEGLPNMNAQADRLGPFGLWWCFVPAAVRGVEKLFHRRCRRGDRSSHIVKLISCGTVFTFQLQMYRRNPLFVSRVAVFGFCS